MEAWPVEEAYVVRPLGSLVLAALLPFATHALARAALRHDPKIRLQALRPVRAMQIGVAWLIGATALGPTLAASPISIEGHAAAVACAAVALVADRATGRDGDARFLVAGLVLATAVRLAVADHFDGAVLLSTGVVFVASYAAYPNALEIDGASSRMTGWVMSALLATLVALPWTLTRIDPSRAPNVGDSTWRLRVDPWDEHAMLANGWASRWRGELDRAHAQGREAVRMGLPEGPALELEAELLAARGRCDEARRTFDRALRARAAEAFGDDAELTAPLPLGGYQLPPTLMTECEGLDQLPGVDDFTLR